MGRERVFLICSECLSRNYSLKERSDRTQRLEIKKYCPQCGKHTLHKESK
ncbi:MAG: 50S ribosomal protein L33 [Bacilli bacterium]|nr:50S ribosomal protein L33 [Bacilli bacterium]